MCLAFLFRVSLDKKVITHFILFHLRNKDFITSLLIIQDINHLCT